MNTQIINNFDDLQAFVLSYDESQNVDYKIGYDNLKENKAQIAKDIASFSNANGGQLVFGVQDKTHDMLGCNVFPINNYENLDSEQLENGLREATKVYLTQAVHLKLIKITKDTKIFIIVNIPESNGLIGFRKESSSPWEFWQRTGQQTSILEFHQIIRLAHQSESYQNKLKTSLCYLDRLVCVSGILRSQMLIMYGICETQGNKTIVPSDRVRIEIPLDIKSSSISSIVQYAKDCYPEYQMRTYFGLNLEEPLRLLIDNFVHHLHQIASDRWIWKKPEYEIEKMLTAAKISQNNLNLGHMLYMYLNECNQIINSNYDFLDYRENIRLQLYN